jgi:hypothetical protein
LHDKLQNRTVNEILGDHRRQSQQGRLALRLYLKHRSPGRTILGRRRRTRGAGRFIVRVDEKLTAFLQLETAIYEFALGLIS